MWLANLFGLMASRQSMLCKRAEHDIPIEKGRYQTSFSLLSWQFLNVLVIIHFLMWALPCLCKHRRKGTLQKSANVPLSQESRFSAEEKDKLWYTLWSHHSFILCRGLGADSHVFLLLSQVLEGKGDLLATLLSQSTVTAILGPEYALLLHCFLWLCVLPGNSKCARHLDSWNSEELLSFCVTNIRRKSREPFTTILRVPVHSLSWKLYATLEYRWSSPTFAQHTWTLPMYPWQQPESNWSGLLLIPAPCLLGCILISFMTICADRDKNSNTEDRHRMHGIQEVQNDGARTVSK